MMDIQGCAALVERGDPDRWAAVLAAPVAARAPLLVLYAFNLEIARAPWASREAMICEMRLQFWRDVVAEAPLGKPRAHEVAGPLAQLIAERGLPVDVLTRMIDARQHDIYAEPFADQAAMDRYLEDTGAGLMWATGLALGGGDEAGLRGLGWATALAAYLRAIPAIEGRGRVPLVDGTAAGVAALARRGLARLAETGAARARLRGLPRAATLAGWQTAALLRMAAATPERVGQNALALSEFSRRSRLFIAATRGRV